jgi:hypothetical protein
MATCYNANWDEDTPCSNGYYLHGIGRNFTVMTDMSALTGGVCCKLQDFSDAYGSCTDVSFTSTLKEWPVCPDNFLLTGIRRANLGNTIDDIIGFQCCSPPSNALPTVIPECQGKIDNFGLAASSTSTRTTCSIGTVDCSASSSSNVGETRKWRLVYRQTIEPFCKDNEVYALTSDRENTQMIIHGKTLDVEKGINIAVLNEATQELEERKTFDIYSSYDENANLLNFLRSITNGKIVIIVTNARKMEWMLSTSDYMKYKKLQRKLKYTIRGLGASHNFRYWHLTQRNSYVLFGRKGASTGSMIEKIQKSDGKDAVPTAATISCTDINIASQFEYNDPNSPNFSVLDKLENYRNQDGENCMLIVGS